MQAGIAALETKLAKVTKEIAQCEDQVREFQGEQNAANTAIREREASLGTALLQKKPIEETIRFIERERVRADGLENARKQVAEQLTELRAKRAAVERELAIATYEQTSQDVKRTLLAALSALINVRDKLQTIPEYGPPRDYTPSPEALQTFNVLGMVRQLDLHRMLIDYEYRAGDFMNEAKGEGSKNGSK